MKLMQQKFPDERKRLAAYHIFRVKGGCSVARVIGNISKMQSIGDMSIAIVGGSLKEILNDEYIPPQIRATAEIIRDLEGKR